MSEENYFLDNYGKTILLGGAVGASAMLTGVVGCEIYGYETLEQICGAQQFCSDVVNNFEKEPTYFKLLASSIIGAHLGATASTYFPVGMFLFT